jgi:sigma-B regulation protein RsbU (phosphoserine phosphatase)
MTVYCEVCAGELSQDRLRVGPLKRVCLDCLSDDQRRALEHDLDVAAQIQARLLPARNFTFGRWQIHYHYQPLGPVSGDHIDLIRPDRTGKALHFLFGDVSGKGVAASILMANLQALFRSLVSQELSLPAIVNRANALFHESTAANSYATLVAGRLNGGGRLELINAGHNPPLLVRDGSVSLLAARAMPLGLAGRTRYESQVLRLEPQDLLFLYTDGLSEALNGAGEEFGAVRLEGTLAGLRGRTAREVVAAVLGQVQAFQSGTPQVDDVTAMAIRRRGRRLAA